MEEKRMGISGSGLALGATVTLRSVGHNADGMQTEPHASPRAHRAEIQPTQDVINQHVTSQMKIFSPFLVSVWFFFRIFAGNYWLENLIYINLITLKLWHLKDKSLSIPSIAKAAECAYPCAR